MTDKTPPILYQDGNTVILPNPGVPKEKPKQQKSISDQKTVMLTKQGEHRRVAQQQANHKKKKSDKLGLFQILELMSKYVEKVGHLPTEGSTEPAAKDPIPLNLAGIVRDIARERKGKECHWDPKTKKWVKNK